MIALGIDDVGACVKIDDTVPGILEGRRATYSLKAHGDSWLITRKHALLLNDTIN